MINRNYIYYLHAFFVAPLFIYLGIKKNQTNQILLKSLLYLGIIVGLYHAYKLYSNHKLGFIYHVNVYHVLFVAPLLIYIGYRNNETEWGYYELLLILGLGLLAHFLFKIYKSLTNK